MCIVYFFNLFLLFLKSVKMHPLFFHLTQLIYPTLCQSCKEKIYGTEYFLCLNCTKSLPLVGDYHQNNPTEKIFWGRFPFGFAYSYLYFQKDNITQHILHGLKYQSKKEMGEWLGYQLGKQLAEIPMAIDDNILLPVPLSAKKIAWRGYNQSEVIAEGISKVTKIPIAHNNLLRIKNTETQTRKNRLERYTNMADAFEIGNTAAIEGKQIILVDDVITTGATLESCALTLLKIPKVKVSVLCGAIATQ
jgi:ComF family protein